MQRELKILKFNTLLLDFRKLQNFIFMNLGLTENSSIIRAIVLLRYSAHLQILHDKVRHSKKVHRVCPSVKVAQHTD